MVKIYKRNLIKTYMARGAVHNWIPFPQSREDQITSWMQRTCAKEFLQS